MGLIDKIDEFEDVGDEKTLSDLDRKHTVIRTKSNIYKIKVDDEADFVNHIMEYVTYHFNTISVSFQLSDLKTFINTIFPKHDLKYKDGYHAACEVAVTGAEGGLQTIIDNIAGYILEWDIQRQTGKSSAKIRSEKEERVYKMFLNSFLEDIDKQK